MRVYVSVDMEGIAGIVHEDQTNPVDPRCAAEYARGRKLMTEEANAAVEGALAAGAGFVLLNDSHWDMRNLLAEELHHAAVLLSGGPKRLSMLEGIEAGFDAALFIGYHAKAGTARAVLDHTMTDVVRDVRLNGRSMGELGLNAALAGSYGVPVALVSGAAADPGRCRRGAGPPPSPVRAAQPQRHRGRFHLLVPGRLRRAGAGVRAPRCAHRRLHAPRLPRAVPGLAGALQPGQGGIALSRAGG